MIATTDFPEFRAFNKIPRFRHRPVIITEKIDGTNGIVHVTDDGRIFADSRNRWLTLEKDNYGFARWVDDHSDELVEGLGEGTHYGEWYGQGIQRRYGLDHKRFAPFNVGRWNADNKPACCEVVPTLIVDTRVEFAIESALEKLTLGGSVAVPGFMDPEGIVVYHSASGQLFKVTLKNDEVPKALVKS